MVQTNVPKHTHGFFAINYISTDISGLSKYRWNQASTNEAVTHMTSAHGILICKNPRQPSNVKVGNRWIINTPTWNFRMIFTISSETLGIMPKNLWNLQKASISQRFFLWQTFAILWFLFWEKLGKMYFFSVKCVLSAKIHYLCKIKKFEEKHTGVSIKLQGLLYKDNLKVRWQQMWP